MNAQFAPMHAALFDRFSVPVTVQRGAGGLPVPSRCIRDDGTAQVGEYGQVIGRVTRVSFLKTEWDPKRGDVVTFADNTAQSVDAIDSDDGFVVGVVLHD